MMLLLHDPNGKLIRVRANRNRPEDAIRKIWPDANNFWPSLNTVSFHRTMDSVMESYAVIEKSFKEVQD